MKLLYCEECGDILAPFREPKKPRWCLCSRHAVWWENPLMGILRVHDKDYPIDVPPYYEARAWVLGVHNDFLQWRGGYGTSKEMIQKILSDTPESYLFKTVGSVIVRIRPGKSADTAYALLPIDLPPVPGDTQPV